MEQKEILEMIASMSNKKQNEFYCKLKKAGMSDEDVKTIQSMVFYFKMFYDPAFYKAVEKSMGETIYAELKIKEATK